MPSMSKVNFLTELQLRLSVSVMIFISETSTSQMCTTLDIKIANRSFENVSQLTHLGMTITNQTLIQGEIKR
jgi:hypothetical protein